MQRGGVQPYPLSSSPLSRFLSKGEQGLTSPGDLEGDGRNSANSPLLSGLELCIRCRVCALSLIYVDIHEAKVWRPTSQEDKQIMGWMENK